MAVQNACILWKIKYVTATYHFKQHNKCIRMMRFGLSLAFLYSTLSYAQCNGSIELCQRRYNEVAYLTTHNAFNADDQGFSFPNQNIGITAQLNLGVRGLMLDVYDMGGVATVYHGYSFLGNEPLVSNLDEIRLFLENNPSEIVTIIFESYVDADMIEGAMNTAGLTSYLYEKPAGQDWDLLGDMVSNNKRLVVFTDVEDAGVGQGWYHYVWDHAVETHFTVNSSAAFTNDFNRGDPVNDLFIFNHFVTSATLGIGMLAEAQVVNQYTFLMNRLHGHFNEYAKFPNFITLDFVDVGNGKSVVDSLNSSGFELETEKLFGTLLVVSPNPAYDYVEVCGLDPGVDYSFEILDFKGRVRTVESSAYQEKVILDLPRMPKSMYILKISQNRKLVYSHKILIE